jgi:hypothetical protein
MVMYEPGRDESVSRHRWCGPNADMFPPVKSEAFNGLADIVDESAWLADDDCAKHLMLHKDFLKGVGTHRERVQFMDYYKLFTLPGKG